DVLWRGERISGAPNGRRFCGQIHQLIGFWIVEGPQQHSMHDRKNGSVCSDPKRQRGDDNSCEPWTLRQRSNRVPYVLYKIPHKVYAAHIPALLLVLRDAPDRALSGPAGLLWRHTG